MMSSSFTCARRWFVQGYRVLSNLPISGRWTRSRARELLAAVLCLALLTPGGPAGAATVKSTKKAAAEYVVELHGSMPSPRPGQHSHHGVMSAWMHQHYPKGYDADAAPAILMPKPKHERTFGVYLKWRAAAAKKTGGTFDWKKVSEPEMRKLSEQMFDAASVPPAVRKEYWAAFAKYKATLRG